jgi:hypothetical protein
MLKKILLISGRPGLYRLISQEKTLFIVESLIDHRRTAVYMRDKLISLSDITIYTSGEDTPLRRVFALIQAKYAGAPIPLNPAALTPNELRAWFTGILPTFDRNLVYPSDIKKAITWYNLLLKEGITNFNEEPAKPNEEKDLPNEELIKPKEELVKPKEELIKPNKELAKPNKELVKPNEELAKPNEELAKPNEELAKPKEDIANPDNNPNIHI